MHQCSIKMVQSLLITTLVSEKKRKKSSRGFWCFGSWNRGNGDFPAAPLKWEMRSRRGKIYNSAKWFFTGKITASHCQCGSNMKRRAALHPGGEVPRLSASCLRCYCWWEATRDASCLLCGSDRAGLRGGTLRRCPAAICQEESPEIFPTDRLNFTTVCCCGKKKPSILHVGITVWLMFVWRELWIMFEVVLR